MLEEDVLVVEGMCVCVSVCMCPSPSLELLMNY